MGKISLFAFALFVAITAAVCGCSSPSPYEHRNNWVVRDNATPQYFADYDVFLLFTPKPERYDFANKEAISSLYDELYGNFVTNFGKKVRIFSPLLRQGSEINDAGLAIEQYLDHYHDPGRHYVILIEGRDAAFEREFRGELAKYLKPKYGFTLLKSEDKFNIDSNFTVRVGNAVYRRKIKATWGVDNLEEENIDDLDAIWAGTGPEGESLLGTLQGE